MALRELGRQGKLYCGLHTLYGDTPTPASADAIRHITYLDTHDPTSKRTSAEKKSSPGTVVRFMGREQAALRQLTCLLRPSGTLNTLAEASEVLEAAFGSKRNVTLSTTVASAGVVGGATLTATTGLAVHDMISIVVTGVKYARRIVTLPGANAVTWAPDLPGAPANGAVVKSGCTYRLTTPLVLSLWLAHYLIKTDNSTAGLRRLLRGVVIDRFAMNFDANEEPQFTASGPAQTRLTGGAVPSKPAAFTTVGGNPPNGLVGGLYVGNAAYSFQKLGLEIANAAVVRNDEYGTSIASDAYRRGRQDINVSIDAFAEDESVIHDPAEAGTNVALFLQTGFTEGNIIALAMPQVEFKTPDSDDPDEEVHWPFRGMCLESADDANDQVILALL